jgi:hypothetical protein
MQETKKTFRSEMTFRHYRIYKIKPRQERDYFSSSFYILHLLKINLLFEYDHER